MTKEGKSPSHGEEEKDLSDIESEELIEDTARNNMQNLHEEAGEILRERDDSHGPTTQNFKKIADLWSTYLGEDVEIAPHEVAEMMILVKISRSKNGSPEKEHYKDIIGYSMISHGVKTALPEG